MILLHKWRTKQTKGTEEQNGRVVHAVSLSLTDEEKTKTRTHAISGWANGLLLPFCSLNEMNFLINFGLTQFSRAVDTAPTI